MRVRVDGGGWGAGKRRRVHGARVENKIIVDVPVSTAYNQWTQFEDLPRFMGGVQRVEQLDDVRLHWVAEIAGVKREWNAEILEQRPRGIGPAFGPRHRSARLPHRGYGARGPGRGSAPAPTLP